jgi:hypothetical protein
MSGCSDGGTGNRLGPGVPWDQFAALLGKTEPLDGEGRFDAAKLVGRAAMGTGATGWEGSVVEATCRLPMTFFPASPSHQSVFSDKVGVVGCKYHISSC